jgi:hypothetical protein
MDDGSSLYDRRRVSLLKILQSTDVDAADGYDGCDIVCVAAYILLHYIIAPNVFDCCSESRAISHFWLTSKNHNWLSRNNQNHKRASNRPCL